MNILVLSSLSKYKTAKSCLSKSTASLRRSIDFPCLASAAKMHSSPGSIVVYELSVGNLNGIPAYPFPCLDFISSQQPSMTSLYCGMSSTVQYPVITSSIMSLILLMASPSERSAQIRIHSLSPLNASLRNAASITFETSILYSSTVLLANTSLISTSSCNLSTESSSAYFRVASDELRSSIILYGSIVIMPLRARSQIAV